MIRSLILITCMALCFGGCKKEAAQTETGQGLRVAASIYPIGDIIKNIGGDKVEVITIMPPGASPHTFDVTPQTIRNISSIKAIFKIGNGLDDWADRVASSVSGNARIIEVSKGIELRNLPDSTVDPHYWLSLSNGVIIATNVAGELASLDPANKDLYAANLEKYKKELIDADNEIKAKLGGVKNKSFATFHEAWFYFAQAYGLRVAAAFEPFPGKEPTPEYLAEFINTVKKNDIKVIFSEPQFSGDAIRQIASDLGVRIDTLDPEGGSRPETMTYIGLMRYNADKLYKALSE